MLLSFASVGKHTRMSRIFREDGKATMVAVNQGITMGPSDGIEDVGKIIAELLPEHPDSFTIHRGAACQYAHLYAGKAALILKSTNRTAFFGPEEVQIADVEDAIALGADAISVGLTLCDPHEQKTLCIISKIVSAAERCGMPTVAHAYPSGPLINAAEHHSPKYVGYAVRVAKELGIDVIKTYWTGDQDSFARIVSYGSPCKVVISGGPKCQTLKDCFSMTWQGIQAGAAGITYGRNIWQHEYPAAVLRGLNAIVHGNASIDEALNIACECAGKTLL